MKDGVKLFLQINSSFLKKLLIYPENLNFKIKLLLGGSKKISLFSKKCF